eukprot:169464_1
MLYVIVRRAIGHANRLKNILRRVNHRVKTTHNPLKFKVIRRINELSQRHPVILATVISTTRTAFCDVYFGQHWIEGRNFNNLNWDRAALFALFGFFYLGLFQYFLYSKLYPLIFNRIQAPLYRALSQTAVDLCIHSPVIYFPTFYVFRSYVYEKKLNLSIVKKSLHRFYFVNFKEDMKHLFIIWTPCIFLCFFVIPIRYRVPWIDFCGISWITLLSVTRGEKDRDIDLDGNKLENKSE